LISDFNNIAALFIISSERAFIGAKFPFFRMEEFATLLDEILLYGRPFIKKVD
jgi:hypothetical protein